MESAEAQLESLAKKVAKINGVEGDVDIEFYNSEDGAMGGHKDGNKGNFSLVNNCSDIVNKGLKEGGLDMPTHFIYHPKQVYEDIKSSVQVQNEKK